MYDLEDYNGKYGNILVTCVFCKNAVRKDETKGLYTIGNICNQCVVDILTDRYELTHNGRLVE